MNVIEIEEAFEALASQNGALADFPFALAAATGVPEATLSKLRSGRLNRSDIASGVLLNGKFHFLPASDDCVEVALERICESPANVTRKVRIAVATDGNRVAARDLKTLDSLHCSLAELGDHFGFFLPLAGFERFRAAEENPVDIRATSRLTKLYDAFVRENQDWASDERRHEMNVFMTRLIFCFFAEDTGIFADDVFTRTVVEYGGRHGENVQNVLLTAFKSMNTPEVNRGELPAWARIFPYVNGGLFAVDLDVPRFSRSAFDYFREAGLLDWKEINPDIFGSMIQSIADPKARSELGMHYTSVPNILKVIGPLFLDHIDAEIQRQWDRPKGMEKLIVRLGRIRVFDPACGSGNFLVVAYRELRAREIRVLHRLQELGASDQLTMWSQIPISNFYGIEITDLAAETAKLALFTAEHQADRMFLDAMGRMPPSLPLRDGARIHTCNALRVDWTVVCPPDGYGGETYVVGNPPFVGFLNETAAQKADKAHVFAGRISSFKKLDFVSCWFLKASDYVRSTDARAALVATNSICQGGSVAVLWPKIFRSDLRISFAHRSFRWRNKAAANAAVICVVVGIGRRGDPDRPILFDGDSAKRVDSINAYLVEGGDIYVRRAKSSPFGMPTMEYGNMPADGGNLILLPEERERMIEADARAGNFIFRYSGSKEVVQDIERYCIWIEEDEIATARSIDSIRERLDAVAAWRRKSDNPDTVEAAERPHRFWFVSGGPESGGVVVPGATSQNRPYLPVDRLCPGTVPANTTQIVYNAPDWVLALVASRLHLIWVATVCGQLKNDYRYSATLGWHTFPVPRLTDVHRDALTKCARDILISRAKHHPSSIADLYAPEGMPEDLLAAHKRNDAVVEALYSDRPFRSDAERLQHLFTRYAEADGVIEEAA